MKIHPPLLAWILFGLLGVGPAPLALGAATAGGPPDATTVGACQITVANVYCWRDWMPIVAQPGPDRGSPLRVKVRVRLDNTRGGGAKLEFRARVLDEAGHGYPITFGAQPDTRLLPAEVAATYRDLDAAARQAVDAKYDVVWTGSLKAGEVREVELLAGDGPYLPVGSAVRVELTWTNADGASTVVTSAAAPIERTD